MELAFQLQSLPPILQGSKFTVKLQNQVHWVFPSSCGYTASSQRFRFSLSLCWRQRRHHYAILCRSELTRQGISATLDRYSYGRRLLGLRSRAFALPTPSINLPALRQASHPIRPLSCLQSAVFNKQLQRPGFGLPTAPGSKSLTVSSVPSPALRHHFCLVPFAEFSQALWST